MCQYAIQLLPPSATQDYRTMNLNESSGEQLQQTLQSMPKGKALMKELVRLIEVSGTSCRCRTCPGGGCYDIALSSR